MLRPVLQDPWVQALGVLAALVGLLLLAYLLSFVLVPLLLAFLVAYVLDPIVDMLEARKVPRAVAITGLALLGIVLLIAVLALLIPSLVSEAGQLIEAARAPAPGEPGPSWLEGPYQKLPLDALVGALGLEGEPGEPRQVLARWVGESVKEFVAANLAAVAGAGRTVGLGLARFLAYLADTAVGCILFLANFALFAFVAGYLLRDFDGIVKALKDLVPPRYRATAFRLAEAVDRQLRGFLRGQLLVCLCLGLMYAVGLTLSGVPFAIPIAAFGAVASFVPYLGLALTIGPALVLTLLEQGAITGHLLGVCATFAIAQLVEGTVLTPKIVGDQVGLSPVWVILAVLVFGNLLGFLGLLLAVPAAASIKVLVVEALDRYRRSPVFGGPGGSSEGSG